ncbi:ribonuclease III [bacterium]|nr:ribonuclease III [bacterium]
MSSERQKQLDELQHKLHYSFRNLDYLEQATCHNSWLFDTPDRTGASFERLEFLGDSVLAFFLGDYLFRTYPNLTEADYSRVRARVASSDFLFQLAHDDLDLGAYIMMSRGEEQSGGRHKKSIVANVFEAVLAAIYLDSSLETVNQVIVRLLRAEIDRVAKNPFDQDYKTQLQEYHLKKYTSLPRYTTVAETGPAHKRSFTVTVNLDDGQSFSGTGRSKKEAQKQAAEQALACLTDLEHILKQPTPTPDSNKSKGRTELDTT